MSVIVLLDIKVVLARRKVRVSWHVRENRDIPF